MSQTYLILVPFVTVPSRFWLCGASSSLRVGLSMRFLPRAAVATGEGVSISPVSSSLPPPDGLPYRSWLQVVGVHVSMLSSPTKDLHLIYNAPMLGAHQQMVGTASPPDILRRSPKTF